MRRDGMRERILKNDRLLCAREKDDTDDARGGESAGD
jgi:hypothetical protein